MDLMEELAFARKCMVKRRIMEAQVQGGVGGGGEVRRVHIIYFLSRRGHVEHPHLVRVHHLSRNGVRLRDVKRWLSELRGKDMPESFAWSYKRKYKAGYVWQDLLDEDLITPISDNEYVLKGSEIVSTSFNNEKCSNDEKEVSTEKKSQYSPQVETTKDQKSSSNGKCRKTSESPLDVSTKTSFEIEEESPRFGSETSSSTDDFSKHEKDKVSATAKQEEENGVRDKNKNNSGHAIPLASNLNDEGDNVNNNISTTRFKKISPPSSVSKSSIEKSSRSSFSGAASHMFRNWITCGAVDTNESAVMVINRSSGSSGVFSNKENNSKKNYKGEAGKREKLEGSERILAHSWLLEEHGGSARNNSFDERKGTRKSKAYESGEKKAVPAAYKPINGPNCSQCGRQFRPEKLHAHMKSCRGKKAMAKSSGGAAAASPRTTTEKTPLRTTENSFQKSSYYLADK